jgi:sec-independent protein translocase protein TatC
MSDPKDPTKPNSELSSDKPSKEDRGPGPEPPPAEETALPAEQEEPSKTAAEDDSVTTQDSTASEDELEESEWEKEEKELGGRMTFLEHLDELRKRIMHALLSIVVTFVVAWIFREEVFGFLSMPIESVVEKLVVIKPTEAFTIYLKVSFVAAVFLAAPYILLQVWLFIAPGLYRKEKGYALPFLLASTVLFVLGGLFAYYVVLPPALSFLLLEFGSKFEHMISAVEFFDFEMLIIIGMGVIFQMPVLVAFLSIFGLITPRFLWKNFRYAILIITIIAAVVSPTTDPFNLFLWSGPMVVLYSLSIGISWLFKRRREAADRSW